MELLIDIQVDDEYAELVDIQSLEAVMIAVLQRHQDALGDAVEVALVITGDEAVQALNRDYRGVDGPTDVLSFAAQEDTAGEPDLALPADLAAEIDRHLGDVIIAYPYAARQADPLGTVSRPNCACWQFMARCIC